MKISSALFGVLFLAGNAVSHPVEDAAADDSSYPLYGYSIPSAAGNTVKPLFYADGHAYFGDASAWTGSVVTNVNFTFSFAAGTLSAAATTNGVTLPDNTLLYIIPDATSPQLVGFTGSKTPSGAVTDRWRFYETDALYRESNNQLIAYFWVKETDVKDIWQLYWDKEDEISGYTRVQVRNYIFSS